MFAAHACNILLLRVPFDYPLRDGGPARTNLPANLVYRLPLLLNHLCDKAAVYTAGGHLIAS